MPATGAAAATAGVVDAVKPRPKAQGRRGDEDPRERILCSECHGVVTNGSARIAMCGRHEHVFFNAFGHTFHIGCFRTAPGCVSLGAATLEDTWFTGHTWQVAICARCASHLGWRYEAPGAGGFFGLILNRLTEQTAEGGT
ncbi:MAG: hypothetical protein HYV63_25560 [Candidatus Schekmanbacteria bacterium]|nr:hypothetical protein [Candidatus Schekmanbacteria bacterium]